MPGAPILHGYSTSSAPQGEGGAARVAAASSGMTNAGFPSNTGFFVWLIIIGVVLPGFLIGGLKMGGFQFVFRSR